MRTRQPTEKTKSQLLAAIIKARQADGLSAKRASQAATITQPTWSRIESGEILPQFGTLFDMAQAVGLAVTIKF